MLVLSRLRNQRIFIDLPDGRRIVVTPVEYRQGKFRIGFEAAQDIKIIREELDCAEPAAR
jgi:sRNA-binding carbon storage regulator CsrA